MAPTADGRPPNGFAHSSLATRYYFCASIEVLFPTFATLCILVRFYLRRKFRIALKWDDWLMVSAVPLLWAIWAVWFCGQIFGPVLALLVVGTALIDIAESKYVIEGSLGTLTPSHFRIYMKLFLTLSQLYIGTSTILKCSVLIFYLRAFGTTRLRRQLIYTMIVLNVALGIATSVGSFCTCIPLHNYWDNPALCAPRAYIMSRFFVGSNVIGLAFDIMMVAFPIPIIWRLNHTSTTKKIAVIAVFCLAVVTCGSVAVRLFLLKTTLKSVEAFMKDDTVSALTLCLLFEVNVGAITVCLPAMSQPLYTVAKSWMDRIRGRAPAPSNYLSTAPTFQREQFSLDGKANGKTETSIVSIEVEEDYTPRNRGPPD